MKRAGDYSMQLDGEELEALLLSMAGNGVMDFDHERASGRVHSERRARMNRAKTGEAQLFEISDAVDSLIDIRLDEYRPDSRSPSIRGFTRQFRWRNIEHDARRYPAVQEVVRANRSVQDLRELAQDTRLRRSDNKPADRGGR